MENWELPGLFEQPERLNTVYLSDKNLYRELILQLKKDLQSCGIPLKILLSRRYSFDELALLLHDCFMEIGATAMFNLVYRVDISETQLAKGMNSPGIDPLKVAEMIIKRELQKVVLRKMYSGSKE